MKKGFVNIILFMIMLMIAGMNVHSQSALLIKTHTDQQVYITGEDAWIDVSISGSIGSARTMRIRMVDRNGQAKAQVEIVPNTNGGSAFMTIPENLISDYYFIDAYVQGIMGSTSLTPIMVINPKAPPINCTSSTPSNPSTPLTSSTSSTLSIQSNKQVYGPREEVNLNINGAENFIQLSALAVREDALSSLMNSIVSEKSVVVTHDADGTVEGEGHVVTARVRIDGKPYANLKMAASLKGSRSAIATGITNADGIVTFILPVYYGQANLVIMPFDKKGQKPIVEVVEQQTKRNAISFPCLKLEENMREDIEARIFNSRLNSRFYGDASRAYAIPERDTSDFYGKPDERYVLDEYVRFPNMEEVIAEIIPPVRVKKEAGVQQLQVLNLPNKSFFDAEPLILVDGVPHRNAKEIIESDPLLIRTIDVITRKYYIGEMEFSGIVHFKTYRGDRAQLRLSDQDLVTQFKGVQESATVQAPSFNASNNRMPDNRNLLLKEQLIKTDASGKISLQFNTSDAQGSYKILVKGVNKENKDVIAFVIITVR
jgi:hypothetical protein